MKCPNCSHLFIEKAESPVKPGPCECGMTEGTRIVRCMAAVGIFITFLLFLENMYEDYVLGKAIREKSIKLKMMRYDHNGRVTEELTR